MKSILVLSMLFAGLNAQAVTSKVTCTGQFKNTKAPAFSIYVLVKDLFSAKPKVLSKKTVAGDDWEQMIFGMKKPAKNEHIANVGLYEMVMGDPAQGNPGATETYFSVGPSGILVALDDGVESDVVMRVYKGTNYTKGVLTNYCAPSYCGDYNYFAELKCTVSTVAAN